MDFQFVVMIIDSFMDDVIYVRDAEVCRVQSAPMYRPYVP